MGSRQTVNTEHQRSIILFDDFCNLCCGLVNCIIRRDADHRFDFVPLQSELGKSLRREYRVQGEDPDTIVFIDAGSVYLQSAAALEILRRLGGAWSLLSFLLIVPSGLRNGVYNLIAATRYRLFGRRDGCLTISRKIVDRTDAGGF